MRQISIHLEKDSSGFVKLYPEETEDMWYAYNLIQPRDRLGSSAVRRIVNEGRTGSTTSQRVHTSLTVTVDKIDFDPAAGQLHISGRVCEENQHVPMGSYHTLDLELHRNFTLRKAEWDSVALETLKDACSKYEKADIAAITLHEGLACICSVTENMTVLRQRIEMTISKKGNTKNEAHEAGLEKFYAAIMEAFLRLFKLDQLKAVLIGSPGFYAEKLKDYMFATAMRLDNRALLKSSQKFIIQHTSSGHKHALNEALNSPAVRLRLADTKYAKEQDAVEKFFKMIHTDEYKAWYGVKEVEKAAENGAVALLLLSNSLFRSNSIAERRRFVNLKEEVESQGGNTMILSSIHESGIRLDGLGDRKSVV